jgi:heptosyltransferase-2
LKRILVIQTASIGDVILATSLLEKLHEKYPDAQIDLVTKTSNKSLFENHPFVHKLFLWDKTIKKHLHLIDTILAIREHKYDMLINLQRFFSSGLISLFSKSKIKLGFRKNPLSIFYTKSFEHHISAKGSLHETERNHKLIEAYTDSKTGKVRLYPSNNDYAFVSQYKTNAYICLAPASLWFTKQMWAEKWSELMDNIPQDYNIYIIGGKSDYIYSQEIIDNSKHKNCINLCGKLSLLQTAALMQHAVMNYVNDSAPMHLASSVDANTTAIFCSTVPNFGFGPLATNSHIVETYENLDCRPCGLHGHKECPKGHFKCGINIEIEKLINTL